MNKRCPCCGFIFHETPERARVLASGDVLDGAYWECVCGTTLFVPLSEE